ncbi:HK97 gp10 family phage protein [Leptolyngbya sp. CCNP1308]|uniref:HK97 gp10 family phage protein n=1 Tax=Leptolyngbya sp. CCNP1308 TaxID=3110255 RepID=UPI002B2112DC|nr:HK97 gp10 family phage protein [Leptolyngbya sp. CCNP1308]MEA5447593.1 HK97 gp10 family phage protein [Leptolyngbya sp. CCNP1308]
MKVSFVASGPLHENPNLHFRRAVSQAMSDTADYGLGILKARTPVRTGRLQNSWFSKIESWNQFYFDNSAPYARFVEQKVLMASRSQPEIDRYLSRALDENIDREMN